MPRTTYNLRYPTVPTLPLFVMDPRRKSGEASPRSEFVLQSGMSFTPTPSDVTSSGQEPAFPRRPERRSQRKSRTNQSEGNRESEEVLVHGGKHRRPTHKPRRKHKPFQQQNEGREISNELSIAGTLSDEVESMKLNLQENLNDSDGRSSNRKSLAKEVERLTVANKELTRRLHASECSQDSGYAPTTTSDSTMFNKESANNLMAKLTEFEASYRAVEKERNHYKNQLAEIARQAPQGKVESTTDKRQLNEDILMLKNLVYRLNLELELYQERLRKYNGDDTPHAISVDTVGSAVTLTRRSLQPLLEAYDETIKEKNYLIQNYGKDMKVLMGKCKDLIADNERLHQEMKDTSEKSEAANAGFSALHHDASIAQEQNDLLINQLDLQKEKLAQVHAVYRDKISEVTNKLSEMTDNFHRCRGDLLTLKGSYGVLSEEYDKLKSESENKVPFSVHSASVSECRRLLDELRRKYETEQSYLTTRVEEMADHRPRLEADVMALRAENARLEAHAKTLDKLITKTQQKCEETQARWVTAKISKDAVKRQLHKAIAFSDELIREQEKLTKQLHAKQAEGSSLVNRMGSLKTRLKDVQKGAWQELDEIEKRISQQESGVGRMKQEYNRETARLQNLVKKKEDIIQRLQQEKSKTEENLEVVWRAATRDQLKLKEVTRKEKPSEETYSEDRF